MSQMNIDKMIHDEGNCDSHSCRYCEQEETIILSGEYMTPDANAEIVLRKKQTIGIMKKKTRREENDTGITRSNQKRMPL